MRTKHYLNLSNGVEALPSIAASGEPFAFTRIRSTTLEHTNWYRLFYSEVSDDLLMHLALGWACVLHDRGTRRPLSKTCYFAVPLIRYVLTRVWLDEEPDDLTWVGPRGGETESRLDEVRGIYGAVIEARSPEGAQLRDRLHYYRRFLSTHRVQLTWHSSSTEHDGDVDYQRRVVGDVLGFAPGPYWTPEQVLAYGLGPADVAEILMRHGWTLCRGTEEWMTDVMAAKGDDIRWLYDRRTGTRKREAKILSEALGGVYSYGTYPLPSELPPSEWPPGWDFERHNLAARL